MPAEGGEVEAVLKDIDLESGMTVFTQIKNHFLFAIASGRVKGGERLPSPADLSRRIGVSLNTVANAYRDLEVMGLVHTRRGHGAVVNEGARARCEEGCRARIIKGLNEVGGEAKAAGMTAGDVTNAVKAAYASQGGS